MDLLLTTGIIPPPGCVPAQASGPDPLLLSVAMRIDLCNFFAYLQGRLYHSTPQKVGKGKKPQELKLRKSNDKSCLHCGIHAAAEWRACLWVVFGYCQHRSGHSVTDGHWGLENQPCPLTKLHDDIDQIATLKFMPGFLCGMCPLSTLISLELKSKHCLFCEDSEIKIKQIIGL